MNKPGVTSVVIAGLAAVFLLIAGCAGPPGRAAAPETAAPEDVAGAESMVLRPEPSGWKIVHIHGSSYLRE